jgi:pimeloyl-ACP methyl ester carboxylesterase
MLMTRRSFASASAAAMASPVGAGLASSGSVASPRASSVNSRLANVNGIKMHYRVVGSGPAMVMLHGWPETSFCWHKVLPRLARKFQIFAPDLRGTGLTERTADGYDKRTLANDVIALLDHLRLSAVYLVGHDMGGKVAYMLAHLKPAAVSKLVLVDCSPPGMENMDVAHNGLWHYGFHMARDFPEMLTKGREREYITAQIRHMSHQKDAISDATIAEYTRHYARHGGMTAGFNYYRTLLVDAEDAASFRDQKLSMPVLTIAGKYSAGASMHPKVQMQSIDSVGVIVDDCGHFVAEEQPEKFCEHLEHFFWAVDDH